MRKHASWLTASLIAATVLVGCDPRDTIEAGPAGGTTINNTNNNTIILCVGPDGAQFNCTDADGDGRPAEGSCTETDSTGTCISGLRPDCDDTNPYALDPGTPELCDGHDQSCPGEPGYGVIDEGCEVSCPDDGDACTTEEVVGQECRHTLDPDCCTSDDDCASGELCTSNTSTVAGVCLDCNDDNICTTDSIADGACANAEIPNCCVDNDDCAGDERCDLSTNACETIVCPIPADICLRKVPRNHRCEPEQIPLCCHGPEFDWECADSRPADLPDNYMWGCPTQGNQCTSCLNGDGDAGCYVGEEFCGEAYDGFDDNMNGEIDEGICVEEPVDPPVEPIDRSSCPLTGAGVINLTTSTVTVQLGTTTLTGAPVEGPFVFGPYGDDQPDGNGQGVGQIFDPGATGHWLWPSGVMSYSEWFGMSTTDKLNYCIANWRGLGRCGEDDIILPTLTASGDCHLPMNPAP